MNRRNFLKSSGLASTSLLIPSFLSDFSVNKSFKSRSGKILVVVQLSGGNDGLNTIVPYRNDIYYKSRPTLGIKSSEVLKVSDELGFNPALQSLQGLYDQGYLSIVNSVGYPNPDRSHFRSMDIWHTASDSNQYLSTGWLGRYLDSNCPTPYYALEVDDSLSLALKGATRNGFAASNPERLKRAADNRLLKFLSENVHANQQEDNVAYLYKVLVETQQSANYLYEQARVHRSRVAYPENAFGKDLKTIAELITADTDTKIYYVSLGGFDTHANQKIQQERLLQAYADGMKAFVEDLKQNSLLDEVLIMTFSEFGRRVEQNASNGTDHGTANNLFLIGGKLQKPGFFNQASNLINLDEGDLKFEIDFRNIYASILSNWLDADAAGVLGGNYKALQLV